MDRIIEVKITGCHLTKSSNLAGVAGEANVTALRIEFDESWDGYAKTITWLNASGETATGVILTADLLEDIVESTRVYIAPIPKAALTLAGETLFSVDGYINGKRQRSVYGKLIVRQGGEFEAIDDVDATTAEEIQSQLETHLEEIQAALAGAEAARDESVQSAASAKESAEAVKEYAADVMEYTDGVFIATYGKTSYEDVLKAYKDGKMIVAVDLFSRHSILFSVSSLDFEDGMFVFVSYGGSEAEMQWFEFTSILLLNKDGWERRETSSITAQYALDNFLQKHNNDEFTPTGDYNPATKKYVDEQIGNVASSGGSITIDTQMSDTSENAVQNKVIKEYVDDKIASEIGAALGGDY